MCGARRGTLPNSGQLDLTAVTKHTPVTTRAGVVERDLHLIVTSETRRRHAIGKGDVGQRIGAVQLNRVVHPSQEQGRRAQRGIRRETRI